MKTPLRLVVPVLLSAVFLASASFLIDRPATALSMSTLRAATVSSLSDDDATEAFAPLLRQYNLLRRSLQAQGGIGERDHITLERMRSRINDFLDDYPTFKPALAAATQLSIWLEDHEAVFTSFHQLVRLDPDNLRLAIDWESHFTTVGDQALLDRVYDALLELRPDDVGLATRLASTLEERGDYARIAELLSQVELHPVQDAENLQRLATAYAALHQFEDAVATLQSIGAEALDDARFQINVERELEDWQRYIELWETEQEIRNAESSQDDLPRAEILTSKGPIIVELFEDHAPNTVANFVTLAESDFWSGTRFHRIESGLIAQGGDPYSRPGETRVPGTGHPGYYIPDEHHFDNARNHFTGTLAMAKRREEDTAGSQFYFGLRPMPWLNGRHTAFGVVVDGMDVVRALEVDDEIIHVQMLRKRDHDYSVDTLPVDEVVGADAPAEPLQPQE